MTNQTDVLCARKEIHAYQNQDGTYKVDIFERRSESTQSYYGQLKDDIDTHMEIPRANISITAYKDESSDEIFTIQMK